MLVNDRLLEIAERIKGDSPTFWKGFCVGALQFESGKPLIWDGGEAIYAGITDNMGNRFYIRYQDTISVSQGERIAACGSSELSIPLRLVAMWFDADFATVAKSIIQGIHRQGKANINSILINYEQIYRQETQQEIKRLKNFQLIAVDFTIVVNLGIDCPVNICTTV
jgi:hypothetical protein